MKSPLNYLGGKSRLTKKIIPLIPTHTCYVEPFCGAAWVLFAKEPSKVEVINDGDGELITFWRVIQNHPEEFFRYYKAAVVSRKLFDLENMKLSETLTDIQRAARYFYIQKLGFGGKTCNRTFGTSTTSPPRINLSTLEESLLEVHWRFEKVVIEHLDACACITRYDRPHTFFYIDPPYWKTAGYAVPWKPADYARLRDTLLKVKGQFIMSINDIPEIRSIFKDFKLKKVTTKYSVSGGRSGTKDRAKSQSELLISNL